MARHQNDTPVAEDLPLEIEEDEVDEEDVVL